MQRAASRRAEVGLDGIEVAGPVAMVAWGEVVAGRLGRRWSRSCRRAPSEGVQLLTKRCSSFVLPES